MFEEVAKLRAARRLWHSIATERFGARDPASARLRFFSGNSGATLTAQQPYNNVVRSTIQCLGAVLGGAQSVHVMGYDEAYELPSEEAVTLSLRTQQIIAFESGVTRTADPLAGSYYVEWLTDEVERRAREVMDAVEQAGGAVAALEAGIPQRWIAESAYRLEREISSGARPKVGVNMYQAEGDHEELRLFHLDPRIAERQIRRLAGAQSRARRRQGRGSPAGSGRRRGAPPQRHSCPDRGLACGCDARRDVGRAALRVRRVQRAEPVVTRPLEGLIVVDLTRFVAGSYATSVLAALGADVVKIEPPDGDPYRRQGTEWVNGESVLFMSLNAGKRSVALDFRTPAGREVLDRLIARADFFVENARPGSLTRHGLDWDSLHERYPALVVGSISGYGDVGPDAQKGGFDLILQAESGLMSVTGSSEAGPVKVGAPLLDVGAGLACALGLVAAHLERLSTGRGHLVSTSLLEFALAGLGTVAAGYLASGLVPGLLGTHSPTFAPYGGFRTADGWIVMAGAGSEELWRRACEVLGAEALIDDERFSDNARRVAHRDELTAALEAILVREPSRHWLDMLGAAGVPVAEVRTLGEVIASEQVAALGSLEHLAHERAGDAVVVAPPLRFDRAPLSYGSAAPGAGRGHGRGARRARRLRGGDRPPGERRDGGDGMTASPMQRPAASSLLELTAEVIERTVEVASVPAPTGDEHRARSRSSPTGGERTASTPVSIDQAGNCWARVRDGSGAAIVLAAHLDTVFGSDTDHTVKRTGDRLFGPGVGDDSVAIASLSAIGRLLASSEGSGRCSSSQPSARRVSAISPVPATPSPTRRSSLPPSSRSRATISAGSRRQASGRGAGGSW